MIAVIVISVGLLLAYANGANDVFKGVATLYGSATAGYRRTLLWGIATTLAGSLVSVLLAQKLLHAFTGKRLVPPAVASDPMFPAAVALAAGLTVLLATRLGIPISTTHALIGALVGAGVMVSRTGIDGTQLASGFVLPLLTSPLVAVAGAVLVYPGMRALRRRLGVSQETCICVGEKVVAVVPKAAGKALALRAVSVPMLDHGTAATCRVRYRGTLLGVRARPVLDALHFLSAGAVSFARGVNDTPKIAALLLVGEVLAPHTALVAVALLMGAGGALAARRVAETMAHRVTVMNPGQGFTANAVTAGLVMGASVYGWPVSTTHVSCGALFGIGAVTAQARWRTVGTILLAWVTTLPLAALLGASFAIVLQPLL